MLFRSNISPGSNNTYSLPVLYFLFESSHKTNQVSISHSRLNVDRFLFERKFFHHLFGLIPPIIILFLLPLSFDTSYSKLLNIFDKAINIYLIFIFSRILISLIEAGFDYYLMRHDMATSPYKGAVEMARLFINCIMILTIVGVLMNLKLSNVLTGLSAFAAVLVLIFKDTLLGFIAGMQLAQNKMVKIGDWITVPNTNANGVVIEVNILTVRVQNFDNTLVYVPSYTLVTGSFQNWCGMVESGVRRISKSIYIDVTTIKAIQPEEVDTFLSDKSIMRFLNSKNTTTFTNDKENPDMKTKLGVFRTWLSLYLESHPNVTDNPYKIIHSLPAVGSGMPIELIFFITTTDWEKFENIQSEIFEEIMCILPAFGLSQFQYTAYMTLWPPM